MGESIIFSRKYYFFEKVLFLREKVLFFRESNKYRFGVPYNLAAPG